MHFRILLLLSTNAARFCPFTVVRRITPAGTCTFISVTVVYVTFPVSVISTFSGRRALSFRVSPVCFHTVSWSYNSIPVSPWATLPAIEFSREPHSLSPLSKGMNYAVTPNTTSSSGRLFRRTPLPLTPRTPCLRRTPLPLTPRTPCLRRTPLPLTPRTPCSDVHPSR